MTPDPFIVLYLSLLVLGLFWLSFAYRLSYIKHRRQLTPAKKAEPVTPPAPSDRITVSIDMDISANFNGKQYVAHVQLADVEMREVTSETIPSPYG